MKEKIDEIKQNALNSIKSANVIEEIENIRVKFLGKKGELTSLLRSMKDVSPEDRPLIGSMVNVAKQEIEDNIEKLKSEILKKQMQEKLVKEKIDVTMPGEKFQYGKKHILNKVLDEVNSIFLGMGYEIAEGPEVELDYYNFEALNIPKNHPARDTQDTFYINDSVVLRSQTSPIQIRVMENKKPPIKIIAPGMVYRSDEVDATHSPVFHQIEGLVVGKGITMAHLKGTLDEFARIYFGENTVTKFRPHHFNFTEPSAEVDVSCFNCGGKGCKMCKGEGWIEILGCGMVHPRVLEMVGIDPEEYSGFAFGMGLERLAMLKYEIDDMRLLYENDARFIRTF